MEHIASKYPITIKEFGEYAALIEWPPQINEDVLYDILRVKAQIEKTLAAYNVSLVPAYHSLTVIANSPVLSGTEICRYLSDLDITLDRAPLVSSSWKIPVCYESDLAPDLEVISKQKELTPKEVIRLHTTPLYTVYCIGFLPGFMYLGGLPETLITPRRQEPRLRVPAGAVGIGGSQTGIYPQESPGGWNLIGNCPVPLFDVLKDPPCFVKVGDRVKFYPVSLPQYQILKIEVATGVYKPEKIKGND
ncbi:5-oxoprolinase subunit PxpB [Ascidiimonas aurantiaca]|uniref:5-oxoprolinase subunit PxpB n=1 Tax=Ascidiimonas aurantiaca TaxID=1685432 RepID=UPI0030EEE879